jgi:hypothetical protein
MLEEKTLWFSQLSSLDDPFEGVASDAAVRNLIEETKLLRRWREFLPPEHQQGFQDWPEWTPETFPGMFDEHGDPKVVRLDLVFRPLFYVNCWHMNPYESQAMWKLYGNDAIAIRSTYQRLFDSLNPDQREIFISPVVYRDRRDTSHAERALDFFESMVRKGMSYTHEQELRAIVQHIEPPINPQSFTSEETTRYQPKGIHVPIDLDVLIDAIYVAPGKQEWFKTLVTRVVKTYGLNKKTEISRLEERPTLT